MSPSGSGAAASAAEGYRTSTEVPASRAKVSPARTVRTGTGSATASARSRSNAAFSKGIPACSTSRTSNRSRTSTSPATWSWCGWLSTRTSIRRAQNGRFAPRRRSVSSGSGPPSTSIVAPEPDSTRMASPWPMSSVVRWSLPSGRVATVIPPSRTASTTRAGTGRNRRRNAAIALPIASSGTVELAAGSGALSARSAQEAMPSSGNHATAIGAGRPMSTAASGTEAAAWPTAIMARNTSHAAPPTNQPTDVPDRSEREHRTDHADDGCQSAGQHRRAAPGERRARSTAAPPATAARS